MKLILSSNKVKSLCFTHVVERAMKGESIKFSFEEVGIHNNNNTCVDCFLNNLKACDYKFTKNKNNFAENVCFLCKKPEKNFNRTRYYVDSKVHDFCSSCYVKIKVEDKNKEKEIQEDTLHYLKNLHLKDKNENS